MPSTWSPNLKIELLADASTNWGVPTNNNFQWAFEESITGMGSAVFPSDANLTTFASSYSDSNTSQQQRNLVIVVTSSVSLSTTREFIVPTIEKQYIIVNNTTGGQSITVKTSAGSGVTIPNGVRAHVFVDGTNVVQMVNWFNAPILASPSMTDMTATRATFTGNAQTTPVVVTYAASITVNCQLSNVFTTTLTGNITTTTISNPQDGQTINWFLTQDAGGSKTIAWPANFRWPAGATTALTTTGNAVDLLTATYRTTPNAWYATLLRAFT